MRLSIGVSIHIALFFCLFSCPQPRADDADLVWSTYLGGSDYDLGYDIAVDAEGSVYVTGVITSPDFPKTAGVVDTIHGGRDIVVVKLFAGGDSLAYVAILGGSQDDEGKGICVDAQGCAVVTGVTNSTDFPATPWAYDTIHNGSQDMVIVKLGPSGSAMEYSTFVGGNGSDWGYAVVLDEAGSACVAGYTDSDDFPATAGAFDVSYNSGYWDAVVVRLSSPGDHLDYATYLGGADSDQGRDVAIDGEGHLHVIGNTSSLDFPVTAGAYDTTHNGGRDVFLARFLPADGSLSQATYLGGSLADYASGIVVDGAGRAFVAGRTLSEDFPTTAGAFDRSHNSRYAADVFVSRFDPDGADLEFSTFLGGRASDEGHGIALGQEGQVFVSGWTHSGDFPATTGSFCPDHSGKYSDAFLVRLDSSGNALTYGTFLGGSGIDLCWALAEGADGSVYLTGETKSADFPTTAGTFCDTMTGDYADIFVCKLHPGMTPAPEHIVSESHPKTYDLAQNWPNPFNAGTQIRYRISQDDRVTIRIYNFLGQQVRELMNAEQAAGEYAIVWDGKNDGGRRVSSGVYLCRIRTRAVDETVKMVVLR
jgi:hypothetical protein